MSISVAGASWDDTTYLFDGIESRNAWYGAMGTLPSIDIIQKFKIEQVGSSAAFVNAGTFVNGSSLFLRSSCETTFLASGSTGRRRQVKKGVRAFE